MFPFLIDLNDKIKVLLPIMLSSRCGIVLWSLDSEFAVDNIFSEVIKTDFQFLHEFFCIVLLSHYGSPLDSCLLGLK